MIDHYSDLERKAVGFALGVVTVGGPVWVGLSYVYGHGQRHVSDLSGIVHDVAMMVSVLAVGAILGITILAEIRGEST